MKKNPLLDKEFLKKLDLDKKKTIFARITALNLDENPIDRIEGKVTGGSINVDGSSSVRRTINLSMIAHEIKINDYYWGLKAKIKVDIGLENRVDNKYDDIIWFKQGIFILTGFNTSQTTNNYTISLSGKDKMCLLNGDCGGSLPFSIDFGKQQIEVQDYIEVGQVGQIEFTAGEYYTAIKDNDKILSYELATIWDSESIYYQKVSNWEYVRPTLKTIIREAVHQYGHEKYSNIIINDLDDKALELLEYRGKEDLFVFSHNGIYDNVKLEHELLKDVQKITSDPEGLHTIAADSNLFLLNDYKYVWNSENKCTPSIIRRYSFGDAVGYQATDLIYTGELVSSLGESLTSILDKIKNMLGSDYEYFYDLDGHFVFQKTKTYINTSWNTIMSDDDGTQYAVDALAESSYTYSFEDSVLITAFNNNPNLAAIKNDYAIWGQRTGANGETLPIHTRYAIDKKPISYTTIEMTELDVERAKAALPQLFPLDKEKYIQNSITYSQANGDDWREIIYHMASDYYKFNQLDDFYKRIIQANGDLYLFGETGYEQYYEDIQGFWRQLFNPDATATWTYSTVPDEIKYEAVETPSRLGIIEKKYYILKDKKTPEAPNEYQLATAWDETITYYTKLEVNNKIHLTTWSCDFYLSEERLKQEKREIPGRIEKIKYQYTKVGAIAQEIFKENTYYIRDGHANYVLATEWKENEIYYTLVSLTDKQIADDIIAIEKQIDNNLAVKKEYEFWNMNVVRNPGLLNFWIEFLDTNGSINKYAVKIIGDRAKAVNDTKITSINFREVPTILFMDNKADVDDHLFTGYYRCVLADKDIKLNRNDGKVDFTISARGKSTKDVLDTMLYNYSYCPESVSITSLPVYYLEPNTRILIYDENSKINGEYIMTKYTLSLTYNGTMSITATKAAERLY